MIWTSFPVFSGISAALWLAAPFFFLSKNKKIKLWLPTILTLLGILIYGTFITLLWKHMGRAPMRTLGETRMLYAFFVSLISLLTFHKWRYAWLLFFGAFMSSVFIALVVFQPETYNKELMPALQSYWFVPHVIVYILSYAVLGVSWLVSIIGLLIHYGTHKFKSRFAELIFILFSTLFFWLRGLIKLFSQDGLENDSNTLKLADNLVYMGFSLLTLGLLFGALWAKEAWGHYWTWDPKETWAFLTFLAYLTYMHYRYHHPTRVKTNLWVLSVSFVVLMLAYQGVNYLPTAANSVHTYSQQE